MNNKIINRLIQKVDKYKKIELLTIFILGFFKILIISLTILFFFLVIDNLFHLTKDLRFIAFIVLFFFISSLLINIFNRLNQLFRSDNIEISLEKQNNHQENLIVNALLFIKENKFRNNDIKYEIIKLASEKIKDFKIINPNFIIKIKKLFLPLILILSLIILYNIIYPDYFQNGMIRILMPLKYIPPITRIKINHNFKNQTLLSGDTFNINFIIKDTFYKNAVIILKHNDMNKITEEIITSDENNNFTYSYYNVRKNFQWKIKAGDYTSNFYNVEVIPQPQILKQKIKITPPNYIKDNPLIYDNIFQLINVPYESNAEIFIKFDKKLSSLCLFDNEQNVKIPFIKTNDFEWKGELFVNKSISYAVKYTFENFKESTINKNIYFAITEDTPPEITINSPLSINITPYDDSFEIDATVNDDYGINNVKLLMKTAKDNNLNELDKIIISSEKIFSKKWFYNYSSLTKKAETNIIEMFISANDNNIKRTNDSLSKSIKIKKINPIEYNSLLCSELIILKHKLKSIIINLNLKDKLLTNEESYKTLSNFIYDIDSLLMKIKFNKMEDIRTSSLHKKINAFRNEYILEKISFDKQIFKSLNDSILNIFFDIDSEVERLIPFTLQKSLSYIINELKKFEQPFDKPLDYNHIKDLFELEKHNKKLEQALKTYHEDILITKLLNLNTLFNKFKIHSLINELERLSINNNEIEIKKEINNLIEKLETILTELFLLKNNINNASNKNILQEVSKLIKRLERTLTIIKLINPNITTDEKISSLTFKLLINSIGHFIIRIEELQSQNHKIGIKGTTLLSAVLFDFKEFKHFYNRKNYSKGESKLKKAISNLSLCILTLKKIIKDEKEIPTVIKTNNDIKSNNNNNLSSITITKPIDIDSFYDPMSLLFIEGNLKSNNGIYETFIDIFVTDNKDVIKNNHSFKINEYFDLPLELKINYELDLSKLELKDNDILIIKLRALEYDESELKTILSNPLKILIKKISNKDSVKDYFEIKSKAYDILYTLINAQKENIKIFDTSEIKMLKEENTEAFYILVEVINNQKLIAKKYHDLINELIFFSKKTYNIPENKFNEILFFADKTINDAFLKSISTMTNLLSVINQNINNAEDYIPLLTEIKMRLNFLLRNLEEISMFFGPSLSITKTSTDKGNQIFEINNITQNTLLEIKRELKKSEVKEQNINALITKYQEKLSFFKIEKLSNEIIIFTNDFINKIKNTPFNPLDTEHNIDLLFHKIFLLIKNEQRNELLNNFSIGKENQTEQIEDIYSNIINSFDKEDKVSPFTESDSIIKMFHKFTISNPENKLDIIKQTELLKSKFNLLNEKLKSFPIANNFNEKEIRMFKSLFSLFKIFELQFLNIKNTYQSINLKELKELYEKLSTLFESINQELTNSFENFKLMHNETIMNFLKKNIKLKDIDNNFNKNIKALTIITSSLKKSLNIILSQKEDSIFLNESENCIKQIIEVINNYQNFAKNIFKKYNNVSEKLLMQILLYKIILTENKTIFIKSIIDEIQKSLLLFEPMLLDIMNELVNKKYLELNELNIKQIERQIIQNSSKINELKNELDKILNTKELFAKEQDRASFIQNEILSLQEKNNLLKNEINDLSTTLDFKMIVIKPDKPYDLPIETKLSLNKVENELLKADQILNEKESLDSAIIRNLIEEIEEIEEKSINDSDTNKKFQKIKSELELLNIDSNGKSKTNLKDELNNELIKSEDKIKSDSLAKIIQSLNYATKFNEEKQNIFENNENYSDKKLKLRYLDLIQKHEKNYEKIELNMQNVKLLSKQFEIKSNKMLNDLKYNISELKQSIESNIPCEETLFSIENQINKINDEFSKEANIKLVNSPFKLYEKGSFEKKSRFFKGNELKEYEDIITLYLKLIAE